MYDEPGEEVLTPHYLLYGPTINFESYNIPYDGTVSDEDYTDINRIHKQSTDNIKSFLVESIFSRTKGTPTL